MKAELFHRGNLVLIAGKITTFVQNENCITAKLLNIANEKAEEDVIVFRNKVPSVGGADQKATRFINAKVKKGTFLSILAIKKPDGVYAAIDFKFKDAVWTFPATETEKERNVFIGFFLPPKESKNEDVANFTTPLYNQGKTEWITVSFWNYADNKMADKALEDLTPNTGAKSKFAVVICGSPRYFAWKIDPNGEMVGEKIERSGIAQAEKDGYDVRRSYSSLSFQV